ncbi:hypothetical protein [Lentzea sp. NPDC060358]|uniref:hypothetical protein n=1 Tax=Lentzea sp. NPDC060358 TaxID=3347103 RepID=UPI003662085E
MGAAVADRLGPGPVRPWPLAEAAVWGEGFARCTLGPTAGCGPAGRGHGGGGPSRARARGRRPRHTSVTARVRAELRRP